MPKAIYEQIYRELKSRIESGFYPPQELLPSENKLIVEFDCSRGTLRRKARICAALLQNPKNVV